MLKEPEVFADQSPDDTPYRNVGAGIAHSQADDHSSVGDPTPYDRTLAEPPPIQALSDHDGGQSISGHRSTSAAVTLSESAHVPVSANQRTRARGAARTMPGHQMTRGGSDLSSPANDALSAEEEKPGRGDGQCTTAILAHSAVADLSHPTDASVDPNPGQSDRGGGHTRRATQTKRAPAKKSRKANHAAKTKAAVPSGGESQTASEVHSDPALAEPSRKAKAVIDTDESAPSGGDGPSIGEPHALQAVATIVDLWRQRQDLCRAAGRLNLQALATCRRYHDGDKEAAQKAWSAIQKGKGDDTLAMIVEPYRQAMAVLDGSSTALEKQLAKIVRGHPVHAWAKDVKGLGDLSLAGLIGEACGNPGDYKSASALWKRFGLAVIEGERQRRVAGAEAALIHGYAPQRRAFAYVVSCNLMKSQGSEGPYRKVYDERKAYELAREVPKAHAHNRALRYMVKRLLRDLWAADRRARGQ